MNALSDATYCSSCGQRIDLCTCDLVEPACACGAPSAEECACEEMAAFDHDSDVHGRPDYAPDRFGRW